MKLIKLVTLALLASCAGAALAQGPVSCEDDDSYDTCFKRYNAGPAEVAAADVPAVADGAVAAMNTGDNEQSTTNDFLPLLRLLLNDDTGATGNQKIGLEWAPEFSDKYPAKLTATLQKRELYEPLDTALRAGGFEDEASALGKTIDAGDEITTAFTLTKSDKKYGRDPDLQNEILGALALAADEDVPPALKKLRVESGTLLALNRAALTSATAFGAIADAGLQKKWRELSEKRIPLEIAYLKSYIDRLDEIGFYGLLDLIDNQPQFTLSLGHVSRDEAVGPDDFSATLAYEFGGRNVNSFREYAHSRQCPDHVDGDKLKSEVECLASYLERGESLKESFRVKIAAEYTKLQRYEFALANTAFTRVEQPVTHLTFSATASRQLGEGGTGLPRPRFDAKVSYDDFSDDPARQDRGIATVTYSYPVAQNVFMTLGAIYATRPEFRGDVDEEVSARLGFTYKLIEKE